MCENWPAGLLCPHARVLRTERTGSCQSGNFRSSPLFRSFAPRINTNNWKKNRIPFHIIKKQIILRLQWEKVAKKCQGNDKEFRIEIHHVVYVRSCVYFTREYCVDQPWPFHLRWWKTVLSGWPVLTNTTHPNFYREKIIFKCKESSRLSLYYPFFETDSTLLLHGIEMDDFVCSATW